MPTAGQGDDSPVLPEGNVTKITDLINNSIFATVPRRIRDGFTPFDKVAFLYTIFIIF
jgi:hypothetical protein